MEKTSNYKMFKFLPHNREISEGKVEELVESIQQRNLLHLAPISVTKQFGIIDGQHRLKAAEKLGVAIYYNVADVRDNGLEEIIALQTHNRWNLKNFLMAYANSGNEEYEKLSAFMEKHNLTIKQALTLFEVNIKQKENSQFFKKGKFIFPENIEKYTLRVEQCKEVCDYIKNKTVERLSFIHNQSFCNALFKFMNIEDMDYDLFMRKLALRLDKVRKCVSGIDYFKTFMAIYNYKNNNPLNCDVDDLFRYTS